MQQVDIPGVLGTVSNLETNALNKANLQAQIRDRQAATQRASVLNSAIPSALNGDKNALDTVGQLDPELFMKMDARQREITAQRTEDMAAVLYTAKKDPSRYSELRDYAINQFGLDPRQIPEQYDEGFIDATAAQVIGVGKMLEEANKGTYEPVRDEQGNIIAQRNTATGKTESDPRAASDRYETVYDKNGQVVGQRNMKTGKVESDPRTVKPKEVDSFDDSTKLRNEFIKGSGDYVKVRDAYNRIEASAADPSAAGDLALIFNYMKVLDPGSTVREGEFATAESSAGVPTQIRNIYNKVLSGQRLGEEQRADFLDRSKRLFAKQEASHKGYVDEYTRLAKQNGLDPSNVIVDFSVTGQEGTPEIKTDADYNALPSGTEFKAPDGTIRVKP